MQPIYRSLILVLIFMFSFAPVANGDLITIDFDNFASTTDFGGGIEDGFLISNLNGPVAVSGQYLGAFSPGNSIHHQSPGIATFELSHAMGDMFELESFQLGTAFNSPVPILVTGFLGGTQVGSDLLFPTPNSYTLTAAPSLQNVLVDRIQFNLGFALIGPTHIDDIVVETMAVPEPTASIVGCFGLAAMLLRRRVRRTM